MRLLRKLVTVLVALAMLAIGVLFAVQNKTPVPLDVLIYRFDEQSLALWVLSALAIGGVLGMAVSSLILLRMRGTLATTRRQVAKLRADLGQLQDETDSAS